jgi:hypothetical protein
MRRLVADLSEINFSFTLSQAFDVVCLLDVEDSEEIMLAANLACLATSSGGIIVGAERSVAATRSVVARFCEEQYDRDLMFLIENSGWFARPTTGGIL